MQVTYNVPLGTYVAVSRYGVIEAIYDPYTHGTLAAFRSVVSELAAADEETQLS